jgi:hypothetical protein
MLVVGWEMILASVLEAAARAGAGRVYHLEELEYISLFYF